MKILRTKALLGRFTQILILAPVIASAFAGSAAHAGRENNSAAREAAQRELLLKAQRELLTAEASKEADPEKYIYALSGVFNASVRRAGFRTEDSEPQECEKYYQEALTHAEKHPAVILKTDQYSNVLRILWSDTRMLSSKTFSADFDRLCKFNNKIEKMHQRDADASMLDALRSHWPGFKGAEEKQYLERAITLRKAALGATSRRLSFLYQQMAISCEQTTDISESEKYRLASIALGDEPSELTYKWLDLSHFYSRTHKSSQEEAAWRKAMDIINKNHLEVNARSWIGLMDILQREGKAASIDEIKNFLLTKPTDTNTLPDLDKYIKNSVDDYIKAANFPKAAELVRKRIAKPVADPSAGMDKLDWHILLSEILLAQGNVKESQAAFNSVLASMALLGRPTDELRSQRARLLEKFGMRGDAQKLQANLPDTRGPVIMGAPMMAKELIEFGHNNNITAFDSTAKRDASGRLPMPHIPRPGSLDGPLLLICEGVVSHTSNNVSLNGKIACRQSDFDNHRVAQIPIPVGTKINDAIKPPPSALKAAPSNSSADGDFDVTEFPSNLRSSLKDRTRPVRIFLEDSAAKSDFQLSDYGSNESYQQLQVWYNGIKPIRISAFSGFLYAPHAVVHIEFNGTFRGCLVARQILLKGNNHIEVDSSITGKNMGQ